MARLVWTFAVVPKWVMLLFAVVAIVISGGLHAFLFQLSLEATCPDNAAANEQFREAATTIQDVFCHTRSAPLPPPLAGPLASNKHSLPNIDSREYLEELATYACTMPSNNALVVWGPKSTGKTRGLDEMAQLWMKQGRVVIRVDLKDLVGGYGKFLLYFRTKRPRIAPIIIFHELQYLNHIGGEALLSDILRTLESKKQSKSLVGVIIETSEYTWAAESANLLRSRESFRSCLVSYMDKQEVKKDLVDVLQAFSSAQFEVVWQAAQGHAGSLDMVFQHFKSGRSLDKAIATVREFTYNMMVAGLNKAPDQLGCLRELDRLRRGNWSLNERNPLSNPRLQYLIERNILFVFGQTNVIPQHEMMRWAIDSYLARLPIEQDES